MLQARDDLGLAVEEGVRVFLLEHVARQGLERDVALQRRLPRLVHGAHPTAGDQLGDLVGADAAADQLVVIRMRIRHRSLSSPADDKTLPSRLVAVDQAGDRLHRPLGGELGQAVLARFEDGKLALKLLVVVEPHRV